MRSAQGEVILGVDLSGPSNHAETALAWFEARGRRLRLVDSLLGASDEKIVALARELGAGARLAVGIDAPLSYQDGGGDRPGDKALRKRIFAAGLRSGSVMTPTMTRMSYLTLRGVAVGRALVLSGVASERIVEVHPGGVFALHGAPIAAVRAFKSRASARDELLAWLTKAGVRGLSPALAASDHLVAACGAAFGCWKWTRGESAWCAKAQPPLHPFDFAC